MIIGTVRRRQPLIRLVGEFNATPLVGMALLRGYECRMQVRARGKIMIKKLPRR
jgi:hypothetical protein